MLKDMIKNTLKEIFKTDYNYLEYPFAMKAKITSKNDNSYTIKILKNTDEYDDKFPEIPNVSKNESEYNIGDKVVILLLYGQLDVYIVGRVET